MEERVKVLEYADHNSISFFGRSIMRGTVPNGSSAQLGNNTALEAVLEFLLFQL